MSLSRIRSRSFYLALFVSTAVPLIACKSDGGNGGEGGSGGDGGDGGGSAGSGGKGGGGSGGKGGSGGNAGMGSGGAAGMTGGAGGTAGVGGMAGMDACPAPADAVPEAYKAPTGKPVKIDFKAADDLTKKFYVVGDATAMADGDGLVKVEKGKKAVLVYDTTPDKTPTDTYEAFTILIKFRSQKLSNIFVGFAADKSRNGGMTINFDPQHGMDGPPGVSDVDSIFYARDCAITDVCGRRANCKGKAVESYGWTAFEPSMQSQTLKATVVPDMATKKIKVRGEYIDAAGDVIDGSVYDWAMNVPQIVGEIAIGVVPNESDVFIDEIEIKAAETIKPTGVITAPDTSLHVWIPENIGASGKVKGIIVATPSLQQPPDGLGDFALYEHLRRFATAYGWAIVSGQDGGKNKFPMFPVGLQKLATASGHAELNTVPVFLESLLNTFVYQGLADAAFVKRVIAFTANKPILDAAGVNEDPTMTEAYEKYPMGAGGRAVPGFVIYSNAPNSVGGKNKGEAFWYFQRYFQIDTNGTKTPDYALWTMTGHAAQTHAVVDSWALYLQLLQEAIKTRTTNNDGTTPLKPADKTKAYLGYAPFTFRSMAQAGTPDELKPVHEAYAGTIQPFPATGYPPAPEKVTDQVSGPQHTFLIGPATALTWQAWHYYRFESGKATPKPVFWTTVPKHGKAGDKRLMKLGFDPMFPGPWKKIEFFDTGSATPLTPVATVNAGGNPEHEYTNLTTGAHNFVARVTDANDKLHFSWPVMAIFTP